MVCLLVDQSDTKSNVKLGGFRFQLQASYMSSHTEELWYNKTVCLWMTIYIYIYKIGRKTQQTDIWLLCSYFFWSLHVRNLPLKIAIT